MEYAEGIKINGLHSFIDFDLTIASRLIGLPTKTSIRKTVPFMNGYYDYSTINGAVSWGERLLQYTFDIVGETVEEMDEKRTEVVNWFCNMHDVDIYDDTIPDYHFHGSFDAATPTEDGEKCELAVSFVCYPFMIKNELVKSIYNKNGSYVITNDGQPTRLYANGNARIVMNGRSLSFNSSKMADTGFVLYHGKNDFEVSILNELTLPYSSGGNVLSNGIVFDVQSDGKVTANGTSTDNAFFAFRNTGYKPANGKYFISCLTKDGDINSFRTNITIYKNGEYIYLSEYGSGMLITIDDSVDWVTVGVRIAPNYVAQNLVFEPKMYRVLELQYAEEVL